MNALILDFLKTNGERSEAEIAKGLHVPMTVIQTHLSQLASAEAVICCKVTRFRGGKKIEGTSCRLSLARTGNPMVPATSPRKGR